MSQEQFDQYRFDPDRSGKSRTLLAAANANRASTSKQNLDFTEVQLADRGND